MRELRLSDREVYSALRRLAHIMSGGIRQAEERRAYRPRVDGRDLTLASRLTAVLEQRDDRRLLVQTHFSLPAAEQAEGRSFRAAPPT